MTIGIAGIGVVASEAGCADLDDHTWFDPVAALGKRGWKYLSHPARFLLAAANQALPGDRGGLAPLGVVTATHHSITRLHGRLYDTVREHGPGELSPLELPGFAINTPATQLAIATGAHALSLTLTNPVVSGLEAITVAATAIRRGRARHVLASATEQRAHGCPEEGGAAVLLGDELADPRAVVVGGLSRFAAGPAALTEVGAALARLTRDPVTVLPCGSTTILEPLLAALRGHGSRITDIAPVTEPRHGTLTPLLLLNTALATAGTSLLLAAHDHGAVSAVVVRR